VLSEFIISEEALGKLRFAFVGSNDGFIAKGVSRRGDQIHNDNASL
jgi:hypothetical protein